MSEYISETAKIIDSEWASDLKLYRYTCLADSRCGEGVSIGDESTVERCVLGNHVAINRRSYINDSIVGDYSYMGINTTMNFTRLGKFCSIGRNVDIGGFDHDYHKFSTMPMFRFQQIKEGEKPHIHSSTYCEVGNDVWIAAGAQVLHKVHIGDGAVVGGGAVVTKDVPAYAIVAGVPARIIKYRFEEEVISQLLSVKWWDWPIEVIEKNIGWLINTDVNNVTLEKMNDIAKHVDCD